MHVLSGILVAVGALGWMAAPIKKLTTAHEPLLRWRDTWGAWAVRGSVFLLAGFGGYTLAAPASRSLVS